MKLIVGLGNPGEKYNYTRHNIGFLIIDSYAEFQSLSWKMDTKFDCMVSKHGDLLLIKPQSFMNNSGIGVSHCASFYKIAPEDILVIHDDVDLTSAKVKKSYGSSSAGHHGVESIIESLGTKDFWRLRYGVGKPEDRIIKVEDWVLMNLSDEEISLARNFGKSLSF